MEKQFKLVEFSKSTYSHNLPDSTNKFSISHDELYLVYKDMPKSIEIFRLDKIDTKITNVPMEFISIDSTFINKCQLKCAVKKNIVCFKYYYPPKNGERHKTVVRISAKFKDELACKNFIEVMPKNLSVSNVTTNKENIFTRDSSILEESVLSQSNIINNTQHTVIEIEKINEELLKAQELINASEVNEEELTQEYIENLLNDQNFIDYVKKVETILLNRISITDLRN